MKGDEPGTKPSFYEFSMLNLFADTWSWIRGQIVTYSRQPALSLNIPSCAALVYKESIRADKLLKVSV